MRSPENVLESLKSKACNKSYKYERLYRNLYNPQFYLLAYQRIQAKPGNMTAGTDGKTIDGMGMARINALIEKMRDFSYQPTAMLSGNGIPGIAPMPTDYDEQEDNADEE